MNANKLNIQWFIEQHQDWENILSSEPYHISISRDSVFGRNLVLFKYNQIESDMSLPIVKECRGVVLDEDTLEVVSYAFNKFFNVQESHADEIDWNTASVSEKIDGSIIKVVRVGDDILVSTNGVIDSRKTSLREQIGCPYGTFYDLFEAAVENQHRDEAGRLEQEGLAVADWLRAPMDWFKSYIEPGKTYVFELTSKWNRVVVKFDEPRLHFLGLRDNATFQEKPFSDDPLSRVFHTPKVFKLGTLDDCLAAANVLDLSQEGYVVRDAAFRRVKVKSPLYVSAHSMRSDDGSLSYKNAIEFIKQDKVDDFVSIWPEYTEVFDDINKRFKDRISSLDSTWAEFESVRRDLPTRRDQARWIIAKCGDTSGFLFAMLDGKIKSIRDAVMSCTNDKLVRLLGYKG